jgi:hypothetical protein
MCVRERTHVHAFRVVRGGAACNSGARTQVVKAFMVNWCSVIDSSLLGCEKDVIVQACDEGNPTKVRHIVQDLYLEVNYECHGAIG